MQQVMTFLAEHPIIEVTRQQEDAFDIIMNKFYTIKTKQNATRNFDKWVKRQIEDILKMQKEEMKEQLAVDKEKMNSQVQFKSFHGGDSMIEETPRKNEEPSFNKK